MQLYRSTGHQGREAISGILTFASLAQATLPALAQYDPSANPTKASHGTASAQADNGDGEDCDNGDDDADEDYSFAQDDDDDGPPRLVSGNFDVILTKSQGCLSSIPLNTRRGTSSTMLLGC